MTTTTIEGDVTRIELTYSRNGEQVAEVAYWPVAIPASATRILTDQWPVPLDEIAPVPVVLVHDPKLYHIGSSGNVEYLNRLRAAQTLSRKYHYFSDSKTDADFEKSRRQNFSGLNVFITERMEALKTRLRDDSVCVMMAKDWMRMYHHELLIAGAHPSRLESMYRLVLAGLCPLNWRGSWPRGFCYAFCPPHHPWSTSGPPTAWNPSADDLRLGKTRPKPTKPMTLPIPNTPVASWDELRRLVAERSPADALNQWFAPWAETPACRDVLAALAGRAQRLEVNEKSLRIIALDHRNAQQVVIEASAPFSGPLAPMSRSAAELVRRHRSVAITFHPLRPTQPNGRKARKDRRTIVASFTKDAFPIKFDPWWAPDLWNADEPFPKKPLVPCRHWASSGDHLWAYHPLRLRQPGELELCRIHCGDLYRALPYGAGGVVLRLLAEHIVPDEDKERRDFALRQDDGPADG